MHDDALPEAQRAALFALSPATARGFYLAGGTALCLHLGHRRSIDIDLFRVESFDPEELLEDLKRAGVNPKTPATKPDTLWIEVEGVKTSLMRFRIRSSMERRIAPESRSPRSTTLRP